MSIYNIVKDAMNQHKKKIELIQWSIISGVSSLVYSQYISQIQQKQSPTRIIFVPSLKSVNELLSPDNEFMNRLSLELIDKIANHPLIQEYNNAPELVMFNSDNIEIMKTIYDLYISQNITRRIPETIQKKFSIGDPKQQLIHESNTIDIFNRLLINDKQIEFIISQIVYQLLLLIPSIQKEIEYPERNDNIHITDNEIISIANDYAITPIHFATDVIQNDEVIKLLSFITNTEFHSLTEGKLRAQKHNDIVQYSITTGPFNQTVITQLKDIHI